MITSTGSFSAAEGEKEWDLGMYSEYECCGHVDSEKNGVRPLSSCLVGLDSDISEMSVDWSQSEPQIR